VQFQAASTDHRAFDQQEGTFYLLAFSVKTDFDSVHGTRNTVVKMVLIASRISLQCAGNARYIRMMRCSQSLSILVLHVGHVVRSSVSEEVWAII